MHVYKGKNNKPIDIFQPKKIHHYIFDVYMLAFFYKNIFLQVDNLNLVTNLKKYCFYAMLIACKCTPSCKKLDCNAKSEPPYFVTTSMLE